MSTRGTVGGLPVDLDSARVARVSLEAFFRIASAWGLSQAEQQALLCVPPSIYAKWHDGQVSDGLTQSDMERISHVLNIYAALHTLLPNPELADSWPHRPNSAPLFGGGTAIAKMLAGSLSDLQDIARYLDSHVAGDF